ncbi:ribonuclease HII [Gloeocapsa sp. PCC 73106]|uniref:ribonuclease HII n=1 Tax=Gloeocapsa sp. PCC 73106 TaxID=102232 RepID=UPI0002ACB624|nr:ribonuclease HII [Gloeocapsa sp. PCC 73106]ELR98325.1 ribonuclease HII [Gloeocapsa sp. PCC 73106]
MFLVAGVDEVGRGCLFGPVVAASVVIAEEDLPSLLALGVKDSKKLSASKRVKLATQIKQTVPAVGIGYATVAEIEELNILRASLLAMNRSVLKLSVQPQLCLIDGQCQIPNLSIPQQTLIRGDQLSPVIAAASIIAKVWRDELIIRWAARYPSYDLANNKGYGTVKHRLALQQYGVSPQHRLSFVDHLVLLQSQNNL